MSRWVIIAGLATILISLVALASLSGSSSQPATEQSLQEPDALEAPETPEPTPEPSPTPTTTPTTPDLEDEQEEQPLQEEQPVQGIRPSDRQAPGPGPRVATIEVSGDASYSCSVGRIDSPRTVRGTNPASYQVRVAPGGSSLDTVMAVCQKITGDSLGVGIIYDGEVKAQDDTSERFGNVSVSWSPVEE